MKQLARAFMAAALFACAGCHSYTILQTSVFSNENGDSVKVEYGQAEKDHTNTFIAPTNKQEMEFKSKLVIRVTSQATGDRYTAWQCMNFLPTGTMYMTDNEEWKFLANGFTFYAYCKQEDGRYMEVYRGTLCEVPKIPNKTKWEYR